MTSSNDKAVEKAAAKKLITDSARNYLTAKITLPLGNPALKKLHTNMFLFTAVPEDFPLKNWETIANALNSGDTRFADYKMNRWYVEGINISVEAKGKAEMTVDLNAFASPTTEFADGRKSFSEAYINATTKSTSTGNSSTKKTSNAVKTTTNTIINDKAVKKYSIPKAVVNAVKKAVSTSKKTDKDKAYAWYQWMDKNVNYDSYTGHKYSPEQILKRGKGNCVDNSRVFRLGCLAMGIKCNFMHGINCCAESCANHQWNKVYINGKGIEVDCGRSLASWGSHWGRCSGGTSEASSSW